MGAARGLWQKGRPASGKSELTRGSRAGPGTPGRMTQDLAKPVGSQSSGGERLTPGAAVSHRWLGIASFGVPEKLGCANLPLNSRQKELCRRKPYLLPSIGEGARLGIQECRSQFRHERWNCLVTAAAQPGASPLFGYELNSGKSRALGAGAGGRATAPANSVNKGVLSWSVALQIPNLVVR